MATNQHPGATPHPCKIHIYDATARERERVETLVRALFLSLVRSLFASYKKIIRAIRSVYCKCAAAAMLLLLQYAEGDGSTLHFFVRDAGREMYITNLDVER